MSDLIPRAAGDDVVIPVRFRRSSFERLASSDDGHSVPVSAGMIGLVRDVPGERGEEVWTLAVWSAWTDDDPTLKDDEWPQDDLLGT
jgi:hypothetical protein